VDVEAWFDG